MVFFLVAENIFALFLFLRAHSPIPAPCLLPLGVNLTDSVLSLQCPSLGHLCVSGLETASGSRLLCPGAVDFALLVLKEGIVLSFPSFCLFGSCTRSSWLPVRMTGEFLPSGGKNGPRTRQPCFFCLWSLPDYLFCTQHFVMCLEFKK